MAMIGFQITGTRADLHDLAYRNSLQVTRLLAAAVAGGVRWQQPEAVERAYRSFLEGGVTGIGHITVLDIEDRILATHNTMHMQSHGLGTAIEDAQEATSRNELYSDRDSDHIFIVAPILIGRDSTLR